MNWLLPKDAVDRYVANPAPMELVYYHPYHHREEMRAACVGIAGALLKLNKEGVYSVSGPQVGVRIPIVCTLVPRDIIRIFVDPYVDGYGDVIPTGMKHIRKAHEHSTITYFTFRGEASLMYTERMNYTNHTGLAAELQYQFRKIEKMSRLIPPASYGIIT